MSLSDYFSDGHSRTPLVGSLSIQSVSPMLKSINLTRTPKLKQITNERIIEFEDGQHSIIDLDMLFGSEPDTNIPSFDRAEKEIFKQILTDLTDLSLNEYTMHYICHSDIKLGTPFTSLKDSISTQLKEFFEYSISRIPFSLWSEVIVEHSQVLLNLFPLSLQKQLVDYRFKFTKAYTRNKIERLLKDFDKSKGLASSGSAIGNSRKEGGKRKEEKKYQVFSTEASDNDPTLLTEDEYTEIMISDVLNTPFHQYLNEILNKNYSKTTLLSFMNFIKNNENEIIRTFNDAFQTNEDFYKYIKMKNRTIENYKKPRGFPLELSHNVEVLYSLSNEVKHEQLFKMKLNNEKHTVKLQPKKKKLSFSDDSFFDS